MKNTSQHKHQMHEHYQQWKQSGLNQIEYAKQHELKIHTFKYWIQKFNKEQNKTTGFIAIDTAIASEIHLLYPNGVELALPSQTSMTILKELIQYGNLCSQ